MEKLGTATLGARRVSFLYSVSFSSRELISVGIVDVPLLEAHDASIAIKGTANSKSDLGVIFMVDYWLFIKD